jgi:hypothetical protein
MTTPQTIDAFKRAVAEDYSGMPTLPEGTVVLPADVEGDDLMIALDGRNPFTAPILFVREDGVQMLIVPRRPRRLHERVLSRVGIHPLDIEVRGGQGGRPLYHDKRYARGVADVMRLERRSFACA